MKLWSWLTSSWFPSMFPLANQQSLPNKRDSSESSDSDDDYFNFWPLCSVPFVYHEIECRNTLIPRPRSGHRIVADSNGNIYCLGGYNPEGLAREDSPNALFKELWKFNISTLIWTKINMSGDPPRLLCSFGALCIDDMLFVQGGTGVPFGRAGSNKLYVCQLSTGFWRKYSLKTDNYDVPPKFYGQALVFDPDEMAIYSVGGTCGHAYHTGVTKINLRNGSAELIYSYNNHENTGSYRHEIALHNKRIYQFGGGTQEIDIGFEKVFYFDLSGKCWRFVKTFPDPTHGYPIARKFHGLVTLDNFVFIIGGGYINPTGIPVGIDDIWKFNLDTFEWTLICKLSRPIYFHSAAISPNGLLTVFGGVQSIQQGNSFRTQRTNSLCTIWLQVPKLGEIAWIAFLNNCADVTKISQSQLIDIGVPPSYVNRLIS